MKYSFTTILSLQEMRYRLGDADNHEADEYLIGSSLFP